jgi:hypothetical protein
MSKGTPALTDQPRIQIACASGQSFSQRALAAVLNEISQMQQRETPVGTYAAQRCLGSSPFAVALWNIVVGAGSTAATGTITAASVLAADTTTINGLVYTAVAGVKADSTEFSIDGTDTDVAEDLASSITADTRSGTVGDLSATFLAAVVTATSTLEGTAGNVVTLVSSNARLTVSGSTFSGGVNASDYTVTFVSETGSTGSSSINRPALSQRRLLDVEIVLNGFDCTVRSAIAATNFIEKFEDKVASTGTGTALDGTYLNQRVGGLTPYENYIWSIEKANAVYTLTPTLNS